MRNGEVYLLDHVYFSRPGPRIVQGLEILAQLTRPDIFSGLIPSETVVKLDSEIAAGCSSPRRMRAIASGPTPGAMA